MKILIQNFSNLVTIHKFSGKMRNLKGYEVPTKFNQKRSVLCNKRHEKHTTKPKEIIFSFDIHRKQELVFSTGLTN